MPSPTRLRVVLVGSPGWCLGRTEVVEEGWQVRRLGRRQVGEGRGGLAWGGAAAEGRPGDNGDGDVERVVTKRTPVPIAGMEGGRLARPVGQHVWAKRRHHPSGVPGWIG